MHKEKIENLLPSVFQKEIRPNEPLNAFLEVMELLHEPAESILSDIEKYYNPYLAPDEFLPYLASWLDISRFFFEFTDKHNASELDKRFHIEPIPSGIACLRELIASAAYLSRWRGTAKGLVELLEISMAVKGIEINEQVIDDSGLPKPFYMEVLVPNKAECYTAFIQQLVELEKPVYVTYRLKFI